MSIKVYTRGNKLWIYGRVNGKGYRYSSGYGSDRIKYVEKNKEYIFNKKHTNEDHSSVPFNEYGKYVLDITSNQRNQFTQRESEQKFKKLCEFFDNMEITDIKSSLIMQWQNSLEFAPKTILNYRSVLNMILETALADEIIERNPLSSVKAPKLTKKLSEHYTLDEINILIDNATGQFKNILEFAFFSGMRPSEIIALKWSDIDFDDYSVLVQRRVRDGNEDMPKGYKERLIDLLPRAYKALRRQLDNYNFNEYVFVNSWKKRYNRVDTLEYKFKEVCRSSDLRVGKFYDTKHSFVTLMLQYNEPETWLTQQLGHENISVTRKHYTGRLRFDRESSEKYG